MDFVSHYDSPLGGMTLASDGEALTGLWFDDQKYFGRTISGRQEEKPVPVLQKAAGWLSAYFSGRVPGSLPPLCLRATPFQTLVYRILLSIPYGRTMTYGQIAAEAARAMGVPRMSAQAVGSAVGKNPISLMIPCHRVVGKNGSLTGYAGGLFRKEKLMELERSTMDRQRTG